MSKNAKQTGRPQGREQRQQGDERELQQGGQVRSCQRPRTDAKARSLNNGERAGSRSRLTWRRTFA